MKLKKSSVISKLQICLDLAKTNFIRNQDNSRVIKISTLRDLDTVECLSKGNRFSNYKKFFS